MLTPTRDPHRITCICTKCPHQRATFKPPTSRCRCSARCTAGRSSRYSNCAGMTPAACRPRESEPTLQPSGTKFAQAISVQPSPGLSGLCFAQLKAELRTAPVACCLGRLRFTQTSQGDISNAVQDATPVCKPSLANHAYVLSAATCEQHDSCLTSTAGSCCSLFAAA